MKTNTARKSGFTLVEIMIVVAIIGLLAAIAIPNFVKARESSQKNACIANMKQIEGAKSNWCMDQKKSLTDTPGTTDLYGTDKYIRQAPECPGGGNYNIAQVDQEPTCSVGGDHDLYP
jgi:prepilin-type N-terminal cleavage/methylation domain-containing protein